MYGRNLDSEETWKRIPKNSIGVEIGVWKGDSSDKFLRRASHMHLVDSWSPISYENSDEHGNYENYLKRYSKLVGSNDPNDFQQYYDNIYNSVVERFKDRSITIHRMSSEQFFKTFTEKVDWVYVDGDHSYEGCLKDLRNCLKIIKPNGMIFGDDYTNKPGVYQAVNQFIAETKLPFNNFYETQYEICIHQV
jgi:hypothetical protein